MTPLQIKTLRAIAALPSTVGRRNHGYGAWRIFGGDPGTVGKLMTSGLARWGVNNWVELTEQGRAALQKIENAAQ